MTDCINRPLAWEHFSSLGFLQEWHSSPKTFMTTLRVQCKQTGADKAAGFRFPHALSKVMCVRLYLKPSPASTDTDL